MSWKDEIKKDFSFDFDREMKNIFEKLDNLRIAVMVTDRYIERKADVDSIVNSLHELEYWYDSVKEKLQ